MLLMKMNDIINYIEENLTNEISLEILTKKLFMSIYEFRRIFSFITGIPISNYIKNRRLSQSIFDLKNTSLTISEIAVKYGYNSLSSYSRAFKEMQNVSPSEARNNNVELIITPKLTFNLSINGSNDIHFRLVNLNEFSIIGYKNTSTETPNGCCDDIWDEFYEETHDILLDNDYYSEPFKQVAAYKNIDKDFVSCIIGAELGNQQELSNLAVETIPESLWSVFKVYGSTNEKINEAYLKIVNEWLPSSGYIRNDEIHNIESFPVDTNDNPDDTVWEIWYPLKKK